MYPLWGKFITLLADYAVGEGKAEPTDADRWKSDTELTPQQRVNVIRRKLGDHQYRSFLKDTFGPRKGPDGKRYTATHASLLTLPFRGYVTTNYDPALEFARMELRPESLTTGTPTWQDDDEVHRWLTGDIFRAGDDCPILWLHGYWQRPQGIVLGGAEYFAAYKPGLYRRLFDALWAQSRLVFVGFGFNDPQFTFMVGEYLHDLENVNALPRHIAILGLPVGKDGRLPDAETIREQRENFEADYHVRPLFYPVLGDDHSALRLLLDSVVVPSSISPSPVTLVSTNSGTLQARWYHEPTNDDKFIGRDDEIARLDRWVRDEAVRAVGISAVGGTGKTALVGHWLKNTADWRSRPFVGLFAWSFYQDRDTANFLYEFLLWAHETLLTAEPNKKTNLVRSALAVLRTNPLVIVLDGLEVLQEGPEEGGYGTFLDRDLREFLTAICQREHCSLAVLTSRFIFTDLDRFIGTAFHQLELHGLTPKQGAKLLDELGVGASTSERINISERLDGHPLGLRVFADALPDEDRDQPCSFLDRAFSLNEIPEGAPLNDKLRRLLFFYEKKLPELQTILLSLVALFRSPVPNETVLRLFHGLFRLDMDDPSLEDTVLMTELKRLQARGILSCEPIQGGYGNACHPILRDHFRDVLLGIGADTARRAADLLKGQPSSGKALSIKDLEPILLAIELLLNAEDFTAAQELYKSRLQSGNIFKWIPAPAEGITCELGFVKYHLRQRVEGKGSEAELQCHLNNAGLHAMNGGHLELALNYYGEADSISRGMGLSRDRIIGLDNEAELLVHLGQLGQAWRTASTALHLATRARDLIEMRDSHAFRGWTATFSGQLHTAAVEFAIAKELKKKQNPFDRELISLPGLWWAELLARSGDITQATERTFANLRTCEYYK